MQGSGAASEPILIHSPTPLALDSPKNVFLTSISHLPLPGCPLPAPATPSWPSFPGVSPLPSHLNPLVFVRGCFQGLPPLSGAEEPPPIGCSLAWRDPSPSLSLPILLLLHDDSAPTTSRCHRCQCPPKPQLGDPHAAPPRAVSGPGSSFPPSLALSLPPSSPLPSPDT